MVIFIILICIFATIGVTGYIFWNDEKILKYIYNYFGNDYKNQTTTTDFIILFIIFVLITFISCSINLLFISLIA